VIGIALAFGFTPFHLTLGILRKTYLAFSSTRGSRIFSALSTDSHFDEEPIFVLEGIFVPFTALSASAPVFYGFFSAINT
jgi:hypothetical protein